ncbi:MFS transporter [Pseudomonas bharatica]|uniref:MFS transporter n=1 Tax=Pseudomonas bharatica TaxID=2692112 RepID=UPI003B27B4E3
MQPLDTNGRPVSEQAHNLPNRSQTLTPWILGVAVLLQTLDATSIAVALPAMAKDLGSDALSVSAVISAYLLGSAAAVPVCGWLADRFGGRNVFLTSILVFVIASLACAMSSSLQLLTAARFIEGVAGAMLMPVGRMIIMRTFAREQRIQAYTTFVLPALMGPMLGPVLGGLLVDHADWRWIFLLNIPLGIVSLLALGLLVKNFRESSPRPIDARGMALTCTAMLGLFYGFIQLSKGQWWSGLLAAGAGFALCLLAVRYSQGREHALLKLSLFKLVLFRRALGIDLSWRLLMNAAPFLLSLLLQTELGLSASLAGLLIVMLAMGSLLTKPITYRLANAFGVRPVMAVSTVTAVLALVTCAFLPIGTSPTWIATLLLTFGFFRSLVISITAVKIFDPVPPEDTGAATTLAAIGQQGFQVMGLTFVTLLMQVLNSTLLAMHSISIAITISGLVALASLYFIWNLHPASDGA